MAPETMTSRSNRSLKCRTTGEIDRQLDVPLVGTFHNHCGTLIYRSVLDSTQLGVHSVRRQHDIARHRLYEFSGVRTAHFVFIPACIVGYKSPFRATENSSRHGSDGILYAVDKSRQSAPVVGPRFGTRWLIYCSSSVHSRFF